MKTVRLHRTRIASSSVDGDWSRSRGLDLTDPTGDPTLMTNMRRIVPAASLVAIVLSTSLMTARQESAPPPIVGRWDMTVTGAGGPYPSWLEVQRSGNNTLVGRFVGGGGSARPISKIEFADDVMRFAIPPQWEKGASDLRVEGKLEGDRLSGSMLDPAGQ